MLTTDSLQDKIALVTGASRGIGRAIAYQLASQGAVVFATSTTQQGADKTSQYFEEQGLPVYGCQVDVTDPDAVKALVQRIKKENKPIDVLVNNAAMNRDNLFLRMKQSEWSQVVDTNLNAVFNVTQQCVRDMLKQRWGRIINIGSVVGSTGNPGQANYSAAKSGLLGLTKSVAHEVAERYITANVVAPGFIDTDMTQSLSEDKRQMILDAVPMARIGKPEEVAHCVGFLASPMADYITGQTFHVNGGLLMD